jgi:mono/diheme cytochrome c family protein
VITTPSGGQVLLDKGFYNDQRPGLVGPRQGQAVDVSVDGGRNWRPARLQGPVMDKCLTRFNIDWVWDGKPALVQSRATDDTGYVQPTYRQSARRARHALDLSQQLDPDLAGAGKRRGEECPAVLKAAAARRWLPGAALAGTPCWPRRHGLPGIGRAATPKEVAAWDIDVRPDFKGLPKGSGSVAKGQDVWEAKCATCHGIFGESNEVFTPLVGGTTKDDVKTGRVARLLDPGFPGRTTLMKVATVSTLWDYIHRAMPWNAPKSLSPTRSTPSPPSCSTWAAWCPTNFTSVDQNIAEVQKRMPNRNGMTLDHHGLWPGKPGLGIGKAASPT